MIYAILFDKMTTRFANIARAKGGTGKFIY